MKILVAVDGNTILTMTPWQGVPPAGTVGFLAANTIAVFDSISVITETEPLGSMSVFADGFESGNLDSWSVSVP